MESFFSCKTNRIITAVTLALGGLALLSFAYSNFHMAKSMYPMPTNISVNGVGEASAVPDVGQFSFSVSADGKDASEAQAASATKINDILTYLKEQGIEDKDIKTQDYNMFPKYRYDATPCFGMYCPPQQQIEDGYTVSQTVMVKVRDTAKAGELIAAVGERGATNISGLTFTVDDPEVMKAEARSKAIADAKTKAEKIAADLGLEIVRITSFYENEGYFGGYGYGGPEMMMDKAADASVAPSTPMGENTTKVSVSVSFEVK